MGYTHYWRWTKSIKNPTTRFAEWSRDVQLLAQHLPERSTTAGGYYDHEPLLIEGMAGLHSDEIANSIAVYFDGMNEPNRPENEEDLSCSPFFITLDHMKKPRYDFCPTGRKPYDLLVCAALIRLKVHFPQIEIASDGDPKEWLQALQLCAEVFGEAALPFPHQGEVYDHSWT